MSTDPGHIDPGTIDPSDPIRRDEPDLDPGLAPDPEHEVTPTAPDPSR